MHSRSERKSSGDVSFSELRDEFVRGRSPQSSPSALFFQQDYLDKARRFLSLSRSAGETVDARLSALRALAGIHFERSFVFSQGFDVLSALFASLAQMSTAYDARIVAASMEYLSALVVRFPRALVGEVIPVFRDTLRRAISRPLSDANASNQCVNAVGVIARMSKENARFLFGDFFPYVCFWVKESVADIHREKLIGGCDYSFRSVRSFTMHLCSGGIGFREWKPLLIKISKFIFSASLGCSGDEPVSVPELSDAIYIFVDVVKDCIPGAIEVIRETQIFSILSSFLISCNIEITRAAILLITYSFDNGVEFTNEIEFDFTFEQLTRFLRHHDSIIRVEAARCLICIFSNQSSQMGKFRVNEIEDIITNGLYSSSLSFPEVINFVHLLLIIIEKYPPSDIYHFDISKFVEYGLDSLENDNDELSYYILQSFLYMYTHLRNLNKLDFFIPQFNALNGIEIISSFSSNEIRELVEISYKLYSEITKDQKLESAKYE